MATDADQFSLRLDHKFSGKDQFFARFNLDNLTGPTTNPDQTAIDPSFGIQYIDRQRNVVGNLYAHSLSAADSRVVHQHHALHAGLSHAQPAPTRRSSSTTASLRLSTPPADR